MELSQQFSLQSCNSFNVEAICPIIYFPNTVSDLNQLDNLTHLPFYILGEGSNTLFLSYQAPIIIKPNFLGIKVTELSDCFELEVGSAENWHKLVEYTINSGIYGLENLALIPGTVGAAPVQNIGAYGVEFADFCHKIEYFDLLNRQLISIDKKKCEFGYRDSIFKSALHNKAIITKVVLRLSKAWRAKIAYQGLNHLSAETSAPEIMQQVIQLREKKLPDPDVLPNAGSFFKNPIVSVRELKRLQNTYPNIPFYPQTTEQVKLAAGWLIEQAGLKGYQTNGVGVHKNQALVLVNYSSQSGEALIHLAQYVQQTVLAKFGVLLMPEVRLVGVQGEVEFRSLSQNYESI